MGVIYSDGDGNLVSGRAKDLFGNYDVAFMVTLILAVIGFVLAIIMLKPPEERACPYGCCQK